LHLAHALVGVGGDHVGAKKPLLWRSASACGPSIGRMSMPVPAAGQLGNGAGRRAAGEEEGVERAVLHLVAGLVGLDVLGLDVGFP
jgi:hypothetical protein